jgi:hypothetical protein
MYLRPQFTPLEEVLLDFSAWFCAFALVWTPQNELVGENLDYQDLEDVLKRADAQRTAAEQPTKKNSQKMEQPHNDHHDHHQ